MEWKEWNADYLMRGKCSSIIIAVNKSRKIICAGHSKIAMKFNKADSGIYEEKESESGGKGGNPNR